MPSNDCPSYRSYVPLFSEMKIFFISIKLTTVKIPLEEDYKAKD